MTNPVEDNVFKILVVADKEQKAQTLKALKEIKEKQADLVKQVEATTITYSEAAEQIRHLNREQLELEGTLEALEDAWKGNNLQLERYEQRLQTVQRSTELAGSIGGTIGQLGGAASGFGIPGASEAAGLGTAVTDAIEAIPKFKVQLQTLGEVARTSTTGIGKLVTGFGNAATIIPGVTAPMASLLAVAAPLAIALAAVTYAVYNYNKGMEAQRKQLELTLNTVSEVNQQVAEGLTTDQAVQRLEELQRAREAEAETLATSEQAYSSMVNQINEELGILGGAVNLYVRATDSREQALADSVKNSQEAISAYDAEIAILTARVEDGSLAANDAAEAEAALTEQRTANIEQMEAEAESIRQQLNASIQQERELYQERKDQARDAAEVETLEQKFALEDQQAQEQEHWSTMRQIASEGRLSIQTLEAELVAAQAEGLAEIAKIEENGRKEAKKLEDDFMKDQLKEQKRFAKEEKRIDKETNKERLRLLEDINDSLEEAAQSNDVNAFLDAQKQGAKDLRRNAEDARDAENERIEDFLDAQAEAQEAFREQHAEILEAVEEEKKAAIEAAQEREQAIKDQIAAEKIAIQEAIKAEQKRYQEQEAQEAQAADRERQRNELARMQEERAFNARITEINREQAAWQTTFTTITAGIQNLKTQAQGLLSMRGSTNTSGYNKNQGTFSKYSTNQAFSAGKFQKSNVNFSPTFTTTVGDIASKAQVTDALKKYANQSMQMMNNLFNGAING